MKKFLCLLSVVALFFTSCSNDDREPDTSSSILVKKITEFENGKPVSLVVKYDGNKIVSVTHDNGYLVKYYYTNDQITKKEEINEKGILQYVTEFSYSNGKMSSSLYKEQGAYNYKTKYVYNNDGTVLYENFKIATSTGIEEKENISGKYTFKDGNLIKLEVAYGNGNSYYTYEYDNKNNPLKNILGLRLLLDEEEASINNVTKETSTSGSASNSNTYVKTYTYKYDANGYPIEKKATFSNGSSTSTETTTYEY